MDVRELAFDNMHHRLHMNPYPGRGLVLGMGLGSRPTLIQVYWIMGRSENSRNRVFATDGKRVWTEAADPAKCKDPRLIIYNAMQEMGKSFIVTNGDQTDTVFDVIRGGGSFEQALATRDYEPDEPNWTPRISGVLELHRSFPVARISLLRRSAFGPRTDRCTWVYEQLEPGFGHCITTYTGDGNPLPAFHGEPFLVPINDSNPEAIAQSFWDALNTDNRVSLCTKAIDLATGGSSVSIINKNKRVASA